MALKAIMLRHKIEKLKSDLEALRAKDTEIQTREAELEAAIAEIETDEQHETVEKDVEAFEAEKAEHEEKKAGLTQEIADLENELAEEERKIPQPKTPEKKKERGMNTMEKINIRSLPMSQRAFDALPMEQRNVILADESVKSFLKELRSMKGQTRAITGGELTIPVYFLDLIAENMYRYSKLLNRVRIRPVSGEARQTIAGTVPEAVWTEMCAAINELTFNFNQVTLDGYKVAGFVPICNSLLEDNDVNLASWIVEMLSESLGLAMD
ncbi:MAG: phage major capsid protein, partial [Thermoguttaceae bacterium]|nr:phage major capsid protein [Thermoguttaceae bacterium]